jgi:1-acyl-sn-glycerol-3-phosphate acyltransferase
VTGTRPAARRHHDLPASAGVPYPHRQLLTRLRPAARAVVRRRFRVEVHGAEHVPGSGAVLLACNHTGWADGPLLGLFAPRPVHSLTKSEMYAGRLGGFLRASGQIELDRVRPDPRAVKASLRVLRDGGVVGVFPEGSRGSGDFAAIRGGAAYLALVTGAPVVPVVMFGVREPGQDRDALPGRGARVDIVLGPSWQTAARPWPRRRADVAAASEELRHHLQTRVALARRLTGRDLPGPLPTTDPEQRAAHEAAGGSTP